MKHDQSIEFGRKLEREKFMLRLRSTENYDDLWEIINDIVMQADEDKEDEYYIRMRPLYKL
jgi:hypothetical protein